MPSGVEAFPSPSRFEMKLRIIYCIALPFLLISGKRSDSGFESNLENPETMPDLPATFIIPLHRQIVPHNEMHSVTASLQEVSAATDKSFIVPLQAEKTKDRDIITKIT